MADSQKYVQLPDSYRLKEEIRRASHRIIELINDTNFFQENLDEKKDFMVNAQTAIKDLKKAFKDFSQLVDKDKRAKAMRASSTTKRAVRVKKTTTTKKRVKAAPKVEKVEAYDSDKALEDLKSSLKELRKQLQ